MRGSNPECGQILGAFDLVSPRAVAFSGGQTRQIPRLAKRGSIFQYYYFINL